MRLRPAIVLPPQPGELDEEETPLLRVADHAIGLWRAAEELGDTALLEALRPLLMRIAHALARDVVDAGGVVTDEDEPPA